ncbi:hypothetical protein RF640_18105 [Kocuria sp. CPCC 205231]|uniref:hypothetical protein n=1 Tax=Kocuria sp. CPCC 205231 TaxID=3073551 RepID=UPI0034D552E1
MRLVSQAMWVMGGCVACALAVGPVAAALGPSAPEPVVRMSATPTLEELAGLPECSDADTAAAVHAVLSGGAQEPDQGLLASPEEVPAGAVTAQGQAFAQLSDEEQRFQQCLGAHQALAGSPQP